MEKVYMINIDKDSFLHLKLSTILWRSFIEHFASGVESIRNVSYSDQFLIFLPIDLFL